MNGWLAGSKSRVICVFAFLATACFSPGVSGSVDTAARDLSREREFWCFQTPVTPARPPVKQKHWPKQPVDYFVLRGFEAQGLTPAANASKLTLLRRASFDLTGLPPTRGQQRSFLNDSRPDSYERLIDGLLASPAFGERLASLWLPLARYAEDQAHQVGNDTKFFYPNAYKYREWVIGAFNRDLPYDQFLKLQLAADKFGAKDELAALGFLGLGPKYYNRGRIEVMADEWEDRIDTVTRTTMGLTVGCARCHDHKFEPISMEDYYALAGVFASTKMVNKSADGNEETKDAEASKMAENTLHIVEDGAVTNLNIFLRGSPERKGPVTERRFVRLLAHAGGDAPFEDGSGRRELAEAIASPENPLTARVFVNRVWGLLFGTPLVTTPSNFGHSGQLPSDEILLDYLATRFVASGWSVKALVRELALSATYRQQAVSGDAHVPGRMVQRRLSIEQWRDAVLLASGELTADSRKSIELDDPQNHRRTVYARISRLKLNDLLMQFDYPDANVHAEKRSATTTPMQKLFMLNSAFIIDQAKALADRVQREGGKDEKSRIVHIYELLFARVPSKDETAAGLQFLERKDDAKMTRWERYAQMLLVCNEMMYVD